MRAYGPAGMRTRPYASVDESTSTSGRDRQCAAGAHRVACVERQIDEHLLELRAVGPHPRGGLGHEGERATGAEKAPDRRREVAHGGGEVERFGTVDGAPAECQQLLRHPRGAAGRVDDLADVRYGARTQRTVLEEEFPKAEDDGHHVVDLVRHAPSERSDGLHALRVLEPFLGEMCGMLDSEAG